MKIYFSSESEKLKPYIQDFEKASTGQTLKTALIEALKYCNVLHSKRFNREAING